MVPEIANRDKDLKTGMLRMWAGGALCLLGVAPLLLAVTNPDSTKLMIEQATASAFGFCLPGIAVVTWGLESLRIAKRILAMETAFLGLVQNLNFHVSPKQIPNPLQPDPSR